MTVFYSADLHFGHPNILVYADRPWYKPEDLSKPFDRDVNGKPHWVSREIAMERAERMNTRLAAEINMRCKPTDVLIHVGDFCCYGNDRGIAGVKTKSREWEDALNPKVIHVLGNHDTNNHVKSAGIRATIVKVAHWTCWVQHVPPWDANAIKAPEVCDAYVCGHVHNRWQLEKFEGKPVVNVGVDANNYRPVKHTELINLIKRAQE